MSLRHFHLTAPVLALWLAGCDHAQPVEPVLEAKASPGSGPTLNAPSGTSAVASSPSVIDVSWQDNSGNESGFELHRSTSGPSGSFTLVTRVGANVTSYSNTGLAAVTQYCYEVRAYRTTRNNTSYSSFSSAACATTPAPPPPTAPSNTDVYPASSSSVWVDWTDFSNNEDGFRIERSLDAGGTWTTAFTVGRDSSGFLWSDTGRTSEQQVCYRVIAFNAGGDSPPSNIDCTTPPAAPTNLTATGVDSETVDLTWTDNSAVEDGYDVWTTYGGFVASVEANTTSLRLYGYDDFYCVVARKDGGYSDWACVSPTLPPGSSSSTSLTSPQRTSAASMGNPRGDQ